MNVLRNSLIAGLVFAIMMSALWTMRLDLKQGIIIGLIGGVLFGLAIYYFANSKKVSQQTQIPDSESEIIIHSGEANHFKNREAVGGKLYLTKNNKLLFKSHNYNLQNHSLEIEIKNIAEISFFRSLSIVPNGIKLILKNGAAEKFVVSSRKHWKREIESLFFRLHNTNES